jgi:hypothetical protein
MCFVGSGGWIRTSDPVITLILKLLLGMDYIMTPTGLRRFHHNRDVLPYGIVSTPSLISQGLARD